MTKETRPFTKVYDDILRTSTIKDLEGTERSFTLTNRMIYSRLLVRFYFFKESGSEYFDTNKDIAESLGIDEKTVSRGLKFLQEVGLISVKKIKWRNFPKNVYTDVKDITFNIKQKRKPAKAIPDKTKSDQDLMLVVAPAPVVCYDFEDENDPPF